MTLANAPHRDARTDSSAESNTTAIYAKPFLYTDEEILALMRAAETLKTPHRRATYQTLIGLLASTGMRVGEAIGLDLDHFDASLGVVTPDPLRT